MHQPLLLALPCALCLLPHPQGDDPLPPADPGITRAELEHHVRFLASDEMKGRAPLTPETERAAQYIARSLAEAGVEPAGEDGTYFQATGLMRLDYPTTPRLLFTTEEGEVVEARYGPDFLLEGRGAVASTEKLPLRFFYDYNHSRMPTEGNSGEALYFSATNQVKKRILSEKGIETLEDWGLELTVLRTSARGDAEDRGDYPPRYLFEREEGGCELVKLRGTLTADFERRKFTHVQLLVEERQQPFDDNNVIGRIPGVGTPDNPELAEEVVLLSAHYDHMGVRKAPRRKREDSIFNGADGNASGCAALLELAQAIQAGEPPARTIVFVFATGGEAGAKGVLRYIEAPAAPLEKTVANLNLEALGRPDELIGAPGAVWVTGYKRTTLWQAWKDLGVEGIEKDPRPEESFFKRFQHLKLALAGVVAQSLSSYSNHRDYHSPRDEADKLDYAHLEAATQTIHRAVAPLAMGDLTPQWLDQPVFGKGWKDAVGEDTQERVRAARRARRAESGEAAEEDEVPAEGGKEPAPESGGEGEGGRR